MEALDLLENVDDDLDRLNVGMVKVGVQHSKLKHKLIIYMCRFVSLKHLKNGELKLLQLSCILKMEYQICMEVRIENIRHPHSFQLLRRSQ